MNLLRSPARFLCVFGLAALVLPAQAARYQVIDLGGRMYGSGASAINNWGQVAGWAVAVEGGVQEGFVYSHGRTFPIPSLGGRITQPTAINDRGEVVGSAWTADHVRHAFLYRFGVTYDLGPQGVLTSRALDINNAGQVVGVVQHDYNREQLFLYANGSYTYPPALSGSVIPHAQINNRGQTIVQIKPIVDPWKTAAYFHEDGQSTVVAVDKINSDLVRAINDMGLVVGVGAYASNAYFFGLYDFRSRKRLDTYLLADERRTAGIQTMNNRGQIIGSVITEGQSSRGHYVYDLRDRSLLWLDELPELQQMSWYIRYIADINDHGVIVGAAAKRFGGPTRAFMLVPIDPR